MWDGGGCWNVKRDTKAVRGRYRTPVKPAIHWCTPKDVRDGLYMWHNFLFRVCPVEYFPVESSEEPFFEILLIVKHHGWW